MLGDSLGNRLRRAAFLYTLAADVCLTRKNHTLEISTHSLRVRKLLNRRCAPV